MSNYSIADANGGRFYVSVVPDYEFVTPYDYLLETGVNSKYGLMQIIIRNQGITGPEELVRKILIRRAVNEWKAEYAGMLAQHLPSNLTALLSAERKSDQIRLTKGMELTTDELTAFIAQAGHVHGFTYSQYRSEHPQKGLDLTKMPRVTLQEDDGSVTKVGETSLSDGQLRNAIAHRKVLIAKFLDKGEDWHCFVYTYDSIGGKEKGNWGEHIHYISSKWGVPRADIVAGVKNGHYVSSGLPHIKFHRNAAPTKLSGLSGNNDPVVK